IEGPDEPVVGGPKEPLWAGTSAPAPRSEHLHANSSRQEKGARDCYRELPLQKPGFWVVRLTPEERSATTDHGSLPEEEQRADHGGCTRGLCRGGSRSRWQPNLQATHRPAIAATAFHSLLDRAKDRGDHHDDRAGDAQR